MLELVDRCNQEHQNIAVTMQWVDYYQKVPAAVAAGQGPDVGIMHVDQIATNAARGVIVPLGGVTEALGLKGSEFAPAVWDAGGYEGTRHGIPLDTLPPGLSILQGAYPTNYAVIMAGGVIASVPVLIIFFIAQRYIIQGVARSGLKG